MKYVHCINDKEIIHFVYVMASCNKFGKFIYTHDTKKNGSIFTGFDGDVDDKYHTYEKHSVKNLTGLLWKVSFNPYNKKDKTIEFIELKSGNNDEADMKVMK
jgi:hypothetical protein